MNDTRCYVRMRDRGEEEQASDGRKKARKLGPPGDDDRAPTKTPPGINHHCSLPQSHANGYLEGRFSCGILDRPIPGLQSPILEMRPPRNCPPSDNDPSASIRNGGLGKRF